MLRAGLCCCLAECKGDCGDGAACLLQPELPWNAAQDTQAQDTAQQVQKNLLEHAAVLLASTICLRLAQAA